MIRDGYVARWRGADYDARPSGDGELRLYSPAPGDGFEEVLPGRYRRVIAETEAESLRYVRTRCVWRGESFVVVGEHEDWLRVEYAGGRSPVAEGMGLDRVDFGLWQTWAPRVEVREVHEEVT